MDVLETSLGLIAKALIVSARWAGRHRLLCLQETRNASGETAQLRAEVVSLRDRLERLAAENALLRNRLRSVRSRKPYPWAQRLRILWHVEYYAIPRRRVTRHLAVARATLYRWLRALQDGTVGARPPKQVSARRTPEALARLVWELFAANPQWGRRRIAMTLWALGVFVAASTVRNILLRGRTRGTPAAPAEAQPADSPPRSITARYPNHVWSLDRTRVYRWGLWPTWVLVAIDHYSRKVTAISAPQGPNAGWVVEAVQEAFARHGTPKHLVTDQEAVFTGGAFHELLARHGVKQRFGAVGKQGSIAVTERAILTLKQEWLQRVPVIKGLDHLRALLTEFGQYYNGWRGHTTLEGAVPDLIHSGVEWQRPDRSAKKVPRTVERHVFAGTGLTAFRLPKAA